MAVIAWPQRLIRHLSASYFLKFTSRSAGLGLSGRRQVVSPGVSSWQIRLDLPRELDGRLMKEFDAYVARMRGRVNVAEFHVCDPFRYGPSVSPAQQPFEDGTWFDDGTGFLDFSATHPMEVTQAAAVGEDVVHVRLNEPAVPRFRPGDEFSYGFHLYRVVASTGSGWVKFEPRARTPIPVAALLETDPPIIRARFASDDEGERTREYLRRGEPVSLNFVEAFDW